MGTLKTADQLRAPAIRSIEEWPGKHLVRSRDAEIWDNMRISLFRGFFEGLCINVLPWMMLNPSKADSRVDDPTMHRVEYFSWLWGFDGCVVMNVYPFRSPSTLELRSWLKGDTLAHEIINRTRVDDILTPYDALMIAWGSLPGDIGARVANDAKRILAPRAGSIELFCLGTNQDGNPKHPMARGKNRVPNDQRPVPFKLGDAAYG